jgi:hypothetical protein
MTIIHQINDFLFELFPKAKSFGNSIDILVEELSGYYSFGVYLPVIAVKGDEIHISIDIPSIISQKPEFDKAVSFCEKGGMMKLNPFCRN